VAYARSESLKKEEVDGLLAKLSPTGNETEMTYWIYLGRLEHEKAQDIAKALSNDQLLAYSYMKELNELENDINSNGEEKQSRMDTLKNNIKTLGEKYTKEEK
jgi:uncharacterized membrane protein YukC